MSRTETISVMFTDIVGSTSLMEQHGDEAWDEHRRAHFTVLRGALASHGGTEVKNTGDGIMAVFGSVVRMVECAAAIMVAVDGARLGGGPVAIRVGGSIGEATSEGGDWFGTPVVEAARLCAVAQPGEALVTATVSTLAAAADVGFDELPPMTLKGFDRPVHVARLTGGDRWATTAYVNLDHLATHRVNIVRSLDYWGGLAAMQGLRAHLTAQMELLPGTAFCDVGCGTGAELARLAAVVGPSGRAVGVDPSPTMIDESRDRAAEVGVTVELHAVDGRATGLDAGSFDSVRIERVVQHVGDLPGFLAEARRILRPGGRVVVADTDWGSLMIHPGDPDLVKRVKSVSEGGPWAEPWAGRKLHAGLKAAGFVDIVSTPFVVNAEPGFMQAMAGVHTRLSTAGVATDDELRAYADAMEAALSDGSGVWAFTMFVASGRRPT